MAVRLVASSDDQALVIRDHLLPLVRQRGTLEVQRDAIRVIALQTEDLLIEHWTPFCDLAPGEASSPGYRHAVEQQRIGSDLPYGLEVSHGGTKVLCVLWSHDGTHSIIEFKRGRWEVEALAL